MPWQSLGQFQLINDWVFSIPIAGEIFRISHQPINGANDKYLKAVIAQGFDDGRINVFNPQRLSYRLESEIFGFYFPSGIAQQKLLFKRLDQTNINWIIEAEVFLSDNTQDDFANYIITRFGELMPLFDTSATTSTPTKKEEIHASVSRKPIEAQVTVLAQESPYRRNLSVYNPSESFITIGCSISESVNGSEPKIESVLVILAPGKIYELPTSGDGSCYNGYLYAQADVTDANNFLQMTEFIAVDAV